MSQQQQQTDELTKLKVMSRNVLIVLMGSIFFASSFIIFAPVEGMRKRY
jgi:hypothetical protein